MSKLLASAGVITGLITALLTLLVAFGVNITPDQHTAIEGIIGAAITLLALWFHPSVPGGASKK